MKKDYVKSLITLLLVFSTTMIFAVTAPVTVNVSDCQGNSIAAFYKVFKGPNYVGQFNAGATVQLEVGQTYKLFAHYDGTSTDRQGKRIINLRLLRGTHYPIQPLVSCL